MSNTFKLATLLAALVFTLTSSAGVTPLVFWFVFIVFAYDTIYYMMIDYLYNKFSGAESYHTIEELFGDKADEINKEIDEVFKKHGIDRIPREDEDEDKGD